jgi:eukaryotic-like serine/threonine-protein kinase
LTQPAAASPRGSTAKSPSISAEQWARLTPILDQAFELPAPDREDYLASACADDPDLRAQVEAFLAADTDAGDFLVGNADAYLPDIIGPISGTAPSDEARTGERIGPYRVVRELGRGGMGIVYLAERADGQFEQRVALKLIKRGMDSELIRRRFFRERQILARLLHPGVSTLLDGGVADSGQPWFAMEYVEGVSIAAYAEQKKLPVQERIRLFEDVCAAIEYAHRKLVIHRDLKPSNILVTAEEHVEVLDFGIAKLLDEDPTTGETLTRVGSRLHTPEYAAPEQVKGDTVTSATDIYALGTVLYELLSGRRPFRLERRTLPELEREILEKAPPSMSAVVPDPLRKLLAGDLDNIVARAMAKDPRARYPTARALAEDLRRHRAGLPVEARPASMAYRLSKFVSRRRTAVIAGSIATVVALGMLASAVVRARVAMGDAANAREVTDFVVSLVGNQSTTTPNSRVWLNDARRRADSLAAARPELRPALTRAMTELERRLGQ